MTNEVGSSGRIRTSDPSPQQQATEEWRDIPGHARYQASSFGRIRNQRGVVLKPFVHTHGYLVVGPCLDGRNVKQYVHRLVAASFIGPCPSGHQVNHIDGRKANNARNNLEYVTPKGNGSHASRTGLVQHGERHYLAKLNNAAVRDIRARRDSPSQLLADEYSVSQATIRRVWNGESWRHIDLTPVSATEGSRSVRNHGCTPAAPSRTRHPRRCPYPPASGRLPFVALIGGAA